MSTTQNETTTTNVWTLDASHSLAEFSAKHMMITTVRGRFGAVEGTLTLDPANPAQSLVDVQIDTASIDTRNEQRDGHLRSADFLDVETYPKITFRSTRIEGGFQTPGDRFKVYGDLTIRGATREVVLDAVYEGEGKDPWGGTRVSFSAETRISRADFGLTWNVALEAGGVLVSDEIKISLEAQAVGAV